MTVALAETAALTKQLEKKTVVMLNLRENYRGEDSFGRLRGDGDGLREWEWRRRLPTSPFFTLDLLGLSSSDEDEEPESINVEESLSGK